MRQRILLIAICAGLGTVIVRLFIIEGIYVASASMEPTYSVGDQLLLEKITLKFREPHRGEIVVFTSPVDEKRDMIKRIIGLPGDELSIQKKCVFINQEKYIEPYAQYKRFNELLQGDTINPLKVPEGMLFVMGDNRDESNDSRDWKNPETGEHIYFIPIRSIKGRVISLF